MKNSIIVLTKKIRVLILMVMYLSAFAGTTQAALDSKGTDFWLMLNSNYVVGSLTLFITSDVNTSGTVSGPSFAAIPFSVVANTVTPVVLPNGLDQHVNDGIDSKGIHISSLQEVTVYGLNKAPFSTDAYLGLPVDVLGTDYIVLNYRNSGAQDGFATTFGIVGTVAATTVTITPSFTTAGHTAGVPYNITLNAGETYELRNFLSSIADLTGTLITSDKPIGVFGTHQCGNIPNGALYADHITEMLPPTNEWGKKFVTVPLASRFNGDTWRILASENSTVVTIDGIAQPMIDKGEFVETILLNQSIIESNKPVLVAQYANGSGFSGNPGDPFMMLIPPFEQFLAHYTMTTVSGFATHYINVVAPNAIVGSLTIDGVAVPGASYTAIGASGFSGAQLSVTPGSHTLSGTLPFGAFQYGFNTDDAYGYPGGQSFAPIASVSTLVLTPATGTDPVNTNNCWEALVEDQNSDPVPGIRVDFNITGANPGQSGFAFTDANGVATFCYAGVNAGVDNINASSGSLSDDATFTWTGISDCAGVVIDVTATPGIINCYGDETCVDVSATGGFPPYTGTGQFCNYGAGTWTFIVKDENGCEGSETITIGQPTKIAVSTTSTGEYCFTNNGTASAIATGGTPGYGYVWQPGGQTTQTATGLESGIYEVTVTDANGCTATATASVEPTGAVPAAPGPIDGQPGLCKGQQGVQFCVPADPNAVSYVWTLPNGVTGSSSGSCITLNVSTKYKGGYICVRAVNPCGTGASTCKNLPRVDKKPKKADHITGPTETCAPAVINYCIPPIADAWSYLWEIKGNGGANPLTITFGQGTTCITVNVPAGYNGNQKIEVAGVNCKGDGEKKHIDLHLIQTPNTPGNINGPSPVCKTQTKNYNIGNVGGATTYNWTASNGAIISLGQGTTHISVNFAGVSASSVLLTVSASNACGTSAQRSKLISVNQNCRTGILEDGVEIQTTSISNFIAFPNPTSGKFTVNFSSDKSISYSIKVIDLLGKELFTDKISAVEGINSKEFDLDGIAKGLYLISIQAENGEIQKLRLTIN